MTATTRMYYARQNYSSGGVDRRKARASLGHSMRLANFTKDPTASKKTEWNSNFDSENVLYCNGRYISFKDFNNDDRVDLIDNIMGNDSSPKRKKNMTTLRNYKHKLKKAIKAEASSGNEDAVVFLQKILDRDDKKPIDMSYLEDFDSVEMTRKDQRYKMLMKYINAHNSLMYQPKNINSTFLQEGLFTFPGQWDVGRELITKKEYIDFTKDFLEKYFPSYDIHAIVLHDDERDNEEDLSPHPHYFIDAQNKVTLDFDLVRAQTVVVNKFIENKNLALTGEDKIDPFPEDRSLGWAESSRLGEILQKLFYEEVNGVLLKGKGVTAVLADETERKSDARKEMNRERKLAKRDRKYNYLTRLKENVAEKEYKINELEVENDDLLTGNNNLSRINNEISDSNDELTTENKELVTENETLKEGLVTKNEIIKQKDTEIERQEGYIVKLNQSVELLKDDYKSLSDSVKAMGGEFIERIQTVFDSISLRIQYLTRNDKPKSEEHLTKIMDNYTASSEKPYRNLCKSIAVTAADNEVVESMDKEDDLTLGI
jgi:hypothetical protein